MCICFMFNIIRFNNSMNKIMMLPVAEHLNVYLFMSVVCVFFFHIWFILFNDFRDSNKLFVARNDGMFLMHLY